MTEVRRKRTCFIKGVKSTESKVESQEYRIDFRLGTFDFKTKKYV